MDADSAKILRNFFSKKSFAKLPFKLFKKNSISFRDPHAKNEIVSEKYFGKFPHPYPRKIFTKKSFVYVSIYKRMETDKIIETIIDLPKFTNDCTHPTLRELDGSIFCTECGVETDRVLQPSINRVWEKRIRR